MKTSKLLLFFQLGFSFCLAQNQVEIPDHIYFAGMKLNLSRGLRENLSEQVQNIQKNKTYFQAKVSLADIYFPIIEKVFTEEDIPLDFKYLAIQESSLQSDAVSTSNAVGYWQFKKESAVEVGLIVNNEIDERKHILESSRGAARYLKKNYLVMTNWVYALIAYNTGLGGAKPFTNANYIGATEMNLDKDLHWYAIKLLAHKLAYEDKVGYTTPQLALLSYDIETAGKLLEKIAKTTEIPEDQIKKYNKWALVGKVPTDKNSVVILPVPFAEKDATIARLGIGAEQNAVAIKDPATTPFNIDSKSTGKSTEILLFTTNNGLDGIIARTNDDIDKLALVGKISAEKFMSINEIANGDKIKKGHIYYFESKKSKGIIPFHTVKAGESLWDIAQVYGIKIKQLKKKNRIAENEILQEGRLLYLRFSRPTNEPIIIAEKPIVKKTETVIPTIKANVKDSIKSPRSVQKPNLQSITTSSVNLAEMPAVIEPLDVKPENILPVTNFAGIDSEMNNTEIKNSTIVKLSFPLPDSSFSYHLVNQSQTLYSLSRYYNTKIDTLKYWNTIGTEGVKFGQKLIVSKSRKSIDSKFQLVSVSENQDLNAIASGLNVTPEQLMQWNDKKDRTVIVGEVLKFR